MFAIRISQPDFIGSTVVTFADEGKARLVVDTLNGYANDGRTDADYLGKCNTTPLTFAPRVDLTSTSLRRQAMAHYTSALPHREPIDVLQMSVDEDGGEARCLVLGTWKEQGK